MPKSKKSPLQQKRSLKAQFYYSDYQRDNTLYATLIRSPASSGFVKSVTLEDIPEGYFLFTADDIPGEKKITLNKQTISIFGHGNISYQGEPVAILLGPNKRTVEELSNKVSVNFDIESLESALKNVIKSHKKPALSILEEKNNSNIKDSIQNPDLESFVSQINEMPSLNTVLDKKHIEENITKIIAEREIKSGLFEKFKEEKNEVLEEEQSENENQVDGENKEKSKNPINELFDKEKYIVTEEEWVQEILAPSWKETSGAFCFFEGKNLHVYAPTKWVHFMMSTISSILDIPKENIFIHKTKISGVYEKGLWRTSILAAQIALASYKTKKPVKLVLSQREQDKYMASGVKSKIKYKTSFSPSGEFKALEADILVDVGSQNPFAQDIINKMVLLSCNYYKPENVHITAKAILSKNPPTSICIKSIDSQIFFAIENHVQLICRQANLLPNEFQKMNFNKSKKSTFSINIPNDRAMSTFEECIKNSDFNRKYAAFTLESKNRLKNNNNTFFALPLRGIGVSTAFVSSNYYGASSIFSNPKIEITLLPDEKVVIHANQPSAVIENIWKNTVSQVLKINKENISINSDYDLSDIPTSPEDFYGSISTQNELIEKACLEIQKKRFFQPLPIISKKTLASPSKKIWDKENFTGNPFANNSFITAVIEVDLDPNSYNQKIKGIWITVDCGELFDEAAAVKTLKLEIQQELTMLVKDKNVECENVNINFIKSKNKSGQIGKLIHASLPAAFSSALSLALNTQLTKLPCTEKLLYTLIKEQKSKEKSEKNNEKGAQN